MATNGSEFESVRTVSVVRHYKLGRSTIPAVDGVSLAARRGEFIALLYQGALGRTPDANLAGWQMIAAVLPAGCVSTHTVFCLRTAIGAAGQHFLCALFNSFEEEHKVPPSFPKDGFETGKGSPHR